MIRRYPHTATVKVVTEVTTDSGIPTTQETSFEVIGRYEPAGQRNDLDQAAKFYCRKLEILKTNPKALDGQKLIFNGAFIGISQAFNYQTHCELWLD